jgi:hypothetical protein
VNGKLIRPYGVMKISGKRSGRVGLILKSRSDVITVKVDGSRINIAGRRYESAHVMILDAEALEMTVLPSKMSINARFSDLPEIQDSTPHILKVGVRGATLKLDLEGNTIRSIKENDSIIVEAELLTFKFESSEDGEKVVFKMPRLDPIRAGMLVVESSSPTSVNAIMDPFIIGVVSIRPLRAARIAYERSRDAIRVTA